MRLWRITRHPAMDGAGGLFADGRWHTKGHRVIYTATSPPGALIECLVHLDLHPDELPTGLRLIGIDIEAATPPAIARLRRGWEDDLRLTQRRGDAWLAAGADPALRVPSAILPETWNVLINPTLPGATARVVYDRRLRLDARLAR